MQRRMKRGETQSLYKFRCFTVNIRLGSTIEVIHRLSDVMPNSVQTGKFEIGNAPAVPRSGGIEEEQALFALIDLCNTDEIIDRDSIAQMRESLTPWVAQQSGVLSEIFDRDRNVAAALRMAEIAIIVASLIQDPVRLSANLLSAGNIYFRHGRRDAAPGFYETILELPPFNARSERVGANQGMAN